MAVRSMTSSRMRTPGLLSAVGVLVRARLTIARNTYWRGSIRRKIGVIFFAGLMAFAAWGLYWLMNGAIRLITSPGFTDALQRAARETPGLPADIQPYLLALPSLALCGALILLIFTSFSSVLSALYLSGDIDMLVVAPVPMRAVFVVKFFGGLILPYLLLFFLAGPALIGYGRGMHFNAAFFLVTAVVLALFPLLPAGLGALLVMGVVRVIPARRARDIVGALGGIFGASWYILNQFARQIGERYTNVQTLDTLRRLDMPLLPSAWAGHALIAAGQGDWGTLLLYGGLFAGLSIAVFGGCLLLAEQLYYIGWSNMAIQGGRVRRKTRRDAAGAGQAIGLDRAQTGPLSRLLKLLPSESRAILAKDLRVFPRDLRNLQQLIFPLAMAGFWTFRLVAASGASVGRRDRGFESFMAGIGVAGISFFICMIFSSALAGSGINREGKGFWLLRIAPVSAQRILVGKLALAYVPFPVAGTLFVALFSIMQHSTFLMFARSLALVLIVGLGSSSIALGLGAAFPRLEWENPKRQTSSRAVLLTFVLYPIYFAVALVAALGLPFFARFVPSFALPLTILGWGLLVALTAGVVWGALSIGAARLERLEIA